MGLKEGEISVRENTHFLTVIFKVFHYIGMIFLPCVKGCGFKHLVPFPYIKRYVLLAVSIKLSWLKDYH